MKKWRALLVRKGIMTSILLVFSMSSYGQEDVDLLKRIETLEKSQKKLSRKINKSKRRFSKKISEVKDRVQFNGFFSTGFTKASEDVSQTLFNQFDGVTDDLCTDCRSIFGLQMTFKIDDHTDLVGQFVSEDATERELKTDWGYIRHQLSGTTTLRAGRIITPYYMKSQYQTVGFAYLWAYPPSLYITSARYFDGVDAKYQFSSEKLDGAVLAFFGSSKSEGGSFDFGFDDLLGLTFELGIGNFKWNMSYAVGSLNITDVGRDPAFSDIVNGLDDINSPDNFTTEDASTRYLTMGFEYDDGVNLFLAEIADLNIKESLINATLAYYVTFGRRFNSWMPYITVGHLESRDNHTDRIRETQAAISNQVSNLETLMSAGQATLAQIATVDAATGQQLLAGLAAQTMDEELIAAVNAGVIDAHDMAGIIAGLSSSIGDLNALSFGLDQRKDIQQTSYSLGVRKVLSSKVALKAEYTVYTDFGNGASHGVFQTKTDDDDVEVYNLVLTAVF